MRYDIKHEKNRGRTDSWYHGNSNNPNSIPATKLHHRSVNRQSRPTNCVVICKQEFIRFCENTTIRGLPRIVKSTTRHLRYFWLTFFILFLIGFLVCIICLYLQYREYDVIHPPRILSDKKAPFPSFTVCNFRSLARDSLDTMKRMGIQTPREFAHAINRYAVKHFYRKAKYDLYSRASSAMNMGAYLESVPNRSYALLGHKERDFIIRCQVTYMDGNNPKSNDCNKLGKWRRIVHPQFINCYSFNLHSNFSQKSNAIEIFLYLDEVSPKRLCMDCFSSDVKSQLSGAIILIHPRLTYPNFNHDTINLQPGTLTEIKLKIFHNKHKQHPYGRCSYNARKYMRIYNDTYHYSEHACKHLTIQHDINRHCGCNAIEKPVDKSHLPFCSHLPQFITLKKCHDNLSDHRCLRQLTNIIKTLACKANVSQKYDKDILEECPLSCDIYSYESDRSTSSWPTKTWQLLWLNTRSASALHLKPELKEYARAYKAYKRGKINETFNILNKQSILEERLLAVMINRPNYNVHLVEEKEVLSLTSFLSQAGGLFSMWIGLTLFSVVELLEMIINTINNFRTMRLARKQKGEEDKMEGGGAGFGQFGIGTGVGEELHIRMNTSNLNENNYQLRNQYYYSMDDFRSERNAAPLVPKEGSAIAGNTFLTNDNNFHSYLWLNSSVRREDLI